MGDVGRSAGEPGVDGLLGFEEVMNLGRIMTLASPSAPAAQVSFNSN
ncbi:hypothetical protein ABT150_41205 [Streptomyces mirabilis]